MDEGGWTLVEEQQPAVGKIVATEGDLESKDDRRDQQLLLDVHSGRNTTRQSRESYQDISLSCAALVSFDNSVNSALGLSEFRFDCWQQYRKN
jgi:hypothetical protein